MLDVISVNERVLGAVLIKPALQPVLPNYAWFDFGGI